MLSQGKQGGLKRLWMLLWESNRKATSILQQHNSKEEKSLGGCLFRLWLKCPLSYPNREVEVKGTPGIEHRGQLLLGFRQVGMEKAAQACQSGG